MSDYQHFLSFTLKNPITGKTQSLMNDWDGTIINSQGGDTYNRECMPDMEDLVDKCDTKDGSIYIDSTVQPRIISMTVFFKKTDGDLTRFKEWVGKKYEQEFMWEDDDENKYIKVKLHKGFESQVYYGGKDFNGKFDLEFIAYDPYYRIKAEKILEFNDIQINKRYNVRSRGNVDCYPILYITPKTNNIVINWNGMDIKLSNLTINREYIMNCEDEEFYYLDNNGNRINCISNFESNKHYDFPVMRNELKNSFCLKSGYCTMELDANSLIL